MKPPSGLKEIIATYGNPAHATGPDGLLFREWKMANLVRLPLPWPPVKLPWAKDNDPIPQLARFCWVHYKAAEAFSAVFKKLEAGGEQSIWSRYIFDYGGTFAFRAKRGGADLSTHAWGIAIDLNVNANPLGMKPTLSTMHDSVVSAFEAEGFEWGGRWKRPDGMHFQLCSGY